MFTAIFLPPYDNSLGHGREYNQPGNILKIMTVQSANIEQDKSYSHEKTLLVGHFENFMIMCPRHDYEWFEARVVQAASQ